MNTTTETNTTTTPAAQTAPIFSRWGLPAPDGTPVSWGARAIYSPSSYREEGYGKNRRTVNDGPIVDILGDRQGFNGEDREAVLALQAWLNTRGLKALRERLKLDYLDVAARRDVRVERGAYVLIANPNASYGYLYLGAWKIPEDERMVSLSPVKLTATQRRALEALEAREGGAAMVGRGCAVKITPAVVQSLLALGLVTADGSRFDTSRTVTITAYGLREVRA